MATANFINHKNGIFALPMLSVEDVLNNYDGNPEDLEDEEIFDIIAENLMFEAEAFLDNLSESLKETKLSVAPLDRYKALVRDEEGKIVAEVELEDGYYEGVQVIVETDPEELYLYFDYDYDEDLEDVYSEDNEDLFSAIRGLTDELGILYRFSNGKTGYTKIN